MAAGRGPLLNAALATSWDIQGGQRAAGAASPAGGEGGRIVSMDLGAVRAQELRERFGNWRGSGNNNQDQNPEDEDEGEGGTEGTRAC